MILKNHVTIDKFMLEKTKDRSELIEYVTKNMERNLVEAMLDQIEPGKDYLIRLRGADYYEEISTNMCGYKMALGIDGWIPCSERLPSKGVAVLVNGIMYDAPPITISTDAPYYYERGWINAWMPLPKPYKEK